MLCIVQGSVNLDILIALVKFIRVFLLLIWVSLIFHLIFLRSHFFLHFLRFLYEDPSKTHLMILLQLYFVQNHIWRTVCSETLNFLTILATTKFFILTFSGIRFGFKRVHINLLVTLWFCCKFVSAGILFFLAFIFLSCCICSTFVAKVILLLMGEQGKNTFHQWFWIHWLRGPNFNAYTKIPALYSILWIMHHCIEMPGELK